MEPQKKRKKRGHYKKYLNPGATFSVPRSTDSSARLRMASAAATSQPVSVSCDLNQDDAITTGPECSAASSTPVGAHCTESQDREFSDTDVRECDLRGNADLQHHDQDAQEQEEGLSEPDAQHGYPGQGEDFDQPDAQDESEQEEDFSQPGALEEVSELEASCFSGSDCIEPPLLSELFGEILKDKVAVSKGDILLMVLKYAIRHTLTFSALMDLVEMINLFFERPVLPHSQHMLKKVIEKAGTTMNFHFFCPECSSYIGDVDPSSPFQCLKCNHNICLSTVNNVSFFVLFDIPCQLQKVLKGCDFVDLTEPLKPKDGFSDICDGELYRAFVSSTANAGHRISFILNADGTPIFKSSGTSIWPIQLLVNELPVAQRMQKMILAALWFGKSKPDMVLFQDAFVEAINDLSEKGFNLEHRGCTKIFKAFCICCAVDSVARAPMQGVMQFNAYHGCNWCLQKGERVLNATKYPVQQAVQERTELEMINDMQEAVAGSRPVNGVRTVSPLIKLEHFNIVWGFVPDYMHCILLGVARQFMEHWLDDTNCKFYMGPQQRVIDTRIMMITPPAAVKRMPRPMKERKFWKAKEWENWLLFYSLPVLEGIAHSKCVQHWACLVEALHIMLQKEIAPAQLAVCEELLLEFHVRAELLYGKSCMTFNMHQLTHIAKSVRQWGPLWAHSAFPFEAGNGCLKKAVKAANGIPHQICRVMQMEETVDVLLATAAEPRVLDYCNSLNTKETQKTVKVKGDVRLFGRGVPISTPSWPEDTSVQYPRMVKGGVIFTGRQYALGKRTNNSVVQLVDSTYAVIENIICKSHSEAFIIVKPLKCRPVKYSLVTMQHMFKAVEEPSGEIVVPAVNIMSACVLLNTQGSTYISPVPSSYTL